MKKLFAVLFAAILLCLALPLAASAAPTDITAKFADTAFKAKVYEAIGKTAPAKIYDTDVAGIEFLNIPGADIGGGLYDGTIQSLAGLEYFTGLKGLYCFGNKLTSLPALPVGLIDLYCYANQLTSLPALPAGLANLYCQDNRLTGLDVTGLTLSRIRCDKNNMKSQADVKGFTGAWDGVNFIFDPQNTTPPAKLTIWQWILKWIFFGWIWM